MLLGLILFELFLIAIYALDTLLGRPTEPISELFDLDGEANLPAWFSSAQLLAVSFFFFFRARQCDPAHGRSPLLFWIVGAVFIFLSADEGAVIHEKITPALTRFSWVPRFRGDHGVWIFVYGLAGVALFLTLRRHLIALWNDHRRETYLMVVGLCFWLGAVGLEIVVYQFLGATRTPRLYPIEVAFEELFEMVGASVILYAAVLMVLPRAERARGSGAPELSSTGASSG
jgi:hypothetical protein